MHEVTLLSAHCRADKYTCPQLDSLARDFLQRNFETVVKCDGRPPNRVGLTSLSQNALMQILTDDNLELSSEVKSHHLLIVIWSMKKCLAVISTRNWLSKVSSCFALQI